MHVFQPVDPSDVDEGPFSFGGLKFLITAGEGDKVNTVATPNGGVGQLSGRRVVFIVLRGKRYTRELIDASGEFSLSFLSHTEFRGAIKYLEAVSGRNEDKIAGARLTVNYDEGIPFIDEADNVITARVLYRQELDKECCKDSGLVNEFYHDDDYYVMYVGEIKKIMIR
ncbi:MAG: flavin reductase [Lachnospiraceae bacterium]|nr:flavin reductase [Lachnospiraceae bacterium]